jgi:hypothetical protein
MSGRPKLNHEGKRNVWDGMENSPRNQNPYGADDNGQQQWETSPEYAQYASKAAEVTRANRQPGQRRAQVAENPPATGPGTSSFAAHAAVPASYPQASAGTPASSAYSAVDPSFQQAISFLDVPAFSPQASAGTPATAAYSAVDPSYQQTTHQPDPMSAGYGTPNPVRPTPPPSVVGRRGPWLYPIETDPARQAVGQARRQQAEASRRAGLYRATEGRRSRRS